jgi:phytoene dehydrogenase-like protein
VFRWLEDFCRFNSYEISIPALKDPSTAPKGKTGLIVSLLFDGELLDLVEKAGWYGEFKEKAAALMLEVLERSIYPDLRAKILFLETATPVTLRNRFGTEFGAITGWSLEGKPPVPRNLPGITKSVRTALPGIFKAGQWSYSPSGVPVAILTGRLAAKAMARAADRL